jgi:hypothetical protein
MRRAFFGLSGLAAILTLAGCGHLEDTNADLFGLGFGIFGGPERTPDESVNPYLWRATLDTLEFLEPLGRGEDGIIATPWRSLPEAPDERFKLRVFVNGPDLKKDNLTVQVMRQVRSNDGWEDAETRPETVAVLRGTIYRYALRKAARASRG